VQCVAINLPKKGKGGGRGNADIFAIGREARLSRERVLTGLGLERIAYAKKTSSLAGVYKDKICLITKTGKSQRVVAEKQGQIL